ncbi:winged helix DNA-binding domain-containing protein [Sunxiuqinia dokdonensis]|uniref:Winged helix DNA-binding domain-containing protein n=1 Tax=Sunxiuqinia dokdonensis TaxID=1409788 RepID=A0A0L8V7R7_9BACT|nr:winged helix DNA-binding domain-containing protein [Sunxiuqinia dokdonensis]KOH44398.1 hypothetical protein NC99_27770 [Sunxiuqinia dokdonensis]
MHARLVNQKLTGSEFTSPDELLAWLGGMQAQDYTSCKWALGLRTPGITDKQVEQSIAERKIVRSWLMRGTLHLAAAIDIRWMLDLLAPRLIKAGAGRHRHLELDEKTFSKSHKILNHALLNKRELSRNELSQILEKNGIRTTGQRMPHILQRAALEKLICFGVRKNKEFTFVLMDEFVPLSNPKSTDEALAELAKRYFSSRSPATLEDFVWWSGLKMTDVRAGLEAVQSEFQQQTINGKTYFFNEQRVAKTRLKQASFLLPAFDEYIIAYRDRSALLDPSYSPSVISKNGIFYPVMVEHGLVIGTWKRILKENRVIIELKPFSRINQTTKHEFVALSEEFATFTGKVASIKFI